MDGEVEQGDGLHHHIEGMDENHRPAAVMLHYKHRETLMLQGMEHHVMHRDGQCRHQDRQPVTVEGQHRQQRENTEVGFDHPVRLVDVQRRHHHQAGTQCTAHHAGAADDAVQRREHHAGAATDDHGLHEGVVPERQAEGEQAHQPDQCQHDAVGLAIVL